MALVKVPDDDRQYVPVKVHDGAGESAFLTDDDKCTGVHWRWP